jgi:trehalose/maltose hydrolase-like predicted phosphorylase
MALAMQAPRVSGSVHGEANVSKLPAAFGHPFRIIAFDWDGTAVAHRAEDTSTVRARIERLLRAGVDIVVITGTNFPNIDRQLGAAIRGPHKQKLFVAANRGSEVYGYDERSAPALVVERRATAEEDRLLDEVAESVRQELVRRTALRIEVIADRLNRRKIDLIPVPAWADPPKSALPALLAAVEERLAGAGFAGGLRAAVAIAERAVAIAAEERGLRPARITSDVKHIEIGLTDKADSMAWILDALAAERGVAPSDILVGGDELGPIAGFAGSDSKLMTDEARGAVFFSVGPEPGGVPPGVIHLGGGPARFVEVLAAQAALHPVAPTHVREREPRGGGGARLFVEDGFVPAREHEVESTFALGNGHLGARASLLTESAASLPGMFVAGAFDLVGGSAIPELVVLPDWTRLEVRVDGHRLGFDAGDGQRRVLDVAGGLFRSHWRHKDEAGRVVEVVETRLVSRADRHVMLQSVCLVPENFSGDLVVEGILSGTRTLVTSRGLQVGIAAATELESPEALRRIEGARFAVEASIGHAHRFDRLLAVVTARGDAADAAARALEHLEEALGTVGAAGIAEAHAASWATRFSSAEVRIEGDERADRALAFAAYHLLSAADPENELVSIGARGLTGSSYKGHVFWDTEIFMLPFFTFTWPEAARALLKYRHHTLPAAQEKARKHGYRGAFYAWESADTGEEVTPPFVVAPDGTLSRILVAVEEQHISADVAYGVCRYWDATGDDALFLEAGAEILLETARFWASRVAPGDDGLFHIEGVIGPDEYHESVHDDAFTNVMAQWNLERAAQAMATLQERWPDAWRGLAARLDLAPDEGARWLDIAARMYTGFDERTGLFEQFRGYFELEDIDLREYQQRTAPMDVLLGRERIQRSQVIKQADVVMLFALLWERFPAEVREANFRYYEPRTDHGSSLSPPVHALVAAKLGDLALAERYFRRTAEIDLENNMGNSAGGVHMAALGGLWQAAVFGFAGLKATEGGVSVAPRLPASWRSMRFTLQWRGGEHTLEVTPPLEERAAEEAAP